MYDYVIVGAGSAGCVLANRLTEDPGVKVLLVEAGPPDTADFIHIPAAFSALFRTQHDWDHMTGWEPGANNRRIYLPRGRMLGGSSSMNAMIYIRGNPLDYDEWRDAGCAGWGWDDLLPYFLRAEDNERGASEFHGAGGPLPVSEARARSASCEAFMEAVDALGLPRNEDFNDGEQDGYGYYQVTQRDGRRASTAVSYLHPVIERENLTVETHAQVLKILFAGGRAAGVAAMRGGETLTWQAEREVIVCGGAYNSPQLLTLSGIGRPDELRAAADRARGGVAGGRHEPPGPPDGGRDVLLRGGELAQGRAQRRQPRPVDAGPGPADLQHRRERRLRPHARRRPGPRRAVPHGPGRVRAGGPAGAARARLHAVGLRAQAPLARDGRGHDARPHRQAVHRARLLHGARGHARPPWPGMRMVMNFCRTEPLARYAETPNMAPASDSDADLEQHVRQNCQTIYHPVGTCRMGADETSVVDPELRVRGVEGLRVVDASVMPSVTRGNTNAPVIAIAERAADLIRGREPARASEASAA